MLATTVETKLIGLRTVPEVLAKFVGHEINMDTDRSKVSTQNLRTQIEPKIVISGDSSQS